MRNKMSNFHLSSIIHRFRIFLAMKEVRIKYSINTLILLNKISITNLFFLIYFTLNKTSLFCVFILLNQNMDQSQWQKSLNSLQNIFLQLQQSLSARMQRFNPFRTLFIELFKTCDKFASNLIAISDACDQQLLITQTQEFLSSSFVGLKSGLLGIAECWRMIAVRSKNQILQPLKVFADNFKKVNAESMNKLKQQLGLCTYIDQEIIRNKDIYYQSCEKLQKHKESQAKIMMRIENGQPGELQKFNKITKNLLEKVGASQKKYMESVQRANDETTRLRAHIQKQAVAMRNNETARVQFLKKVAINQFKLLQLAKNLSLNFKLQNNIARIEGKGRSQLSQALQKIEVYSKSTVTQSYISHEQLVKSKKNKQFQQENPLLMQLFNKVKENDKKSLVHFVHGCLQIEPACQLISIQKGPKNQFKMVFPPQWENFKEKIFSLQHYLYYFSFLLNRQLNEFSNYYIKLSQPFFNHLTSLLLSILDKIDMGVDGAMGQIAVSTAYKILKLAERVVQKRKERRIVNNMNIMIQSLGKCKKLRDQKILKKILKYLVKKSQKKRNEVKGVVSFTKGFFSSLTGKKDEQNSTQQEQFNGLVQLTHLMANLSLPSEISLPFLKNALKNSGQTSYQYLKDIVQGRRDRQQRQKLILQQDPKYKLDKEFKQIIQTKKLGVISLQLVAQKGFLQKSELQLRLCCKYLSNIHYHIIHKLPIELGIQWKWICNPSPIAKYVASVDSILEHQKLSEVQDVIMLDVVRSLHLHIDELPHEKLKKFLVYYSRQHPNMPYCQGMNYLAGFILLKTKMHPSSYAVFCTVMDKYFLQIFNNGFEGMKLKLYLFDRLLSIFHPDISDHFKRQMITPQCYAVGWIITAFTSVYQYTRESVLVDWLWGRFVLWGWREFYKLAMGLMQINREVLLVAGYDRCLQVLGEIPKSPLLLSSNHQSFMKQWGNDLQTMTQVFPITDKLLQKLTNEFSHQ